MKALHKIFSYVWGFFSAKGRAKNSVASFNTLCVRGFGLSLLRWWLGTKGWAKNSVAPFNPLCGRHPLSPTTRGLGLAEVLVASGLGIVIGMASLDTLKVTVQTAQTVKTDLEVQRLAYEVKNFFSKEKKCKETLKPAHLFDKDDQSGQVLVSAGGSALKQIGDWTPSLIEIQGVELLNEGADKNHPQRTLVVLYTKPYVRGRETLEGEACSATDKSGCYYHTCIVDYACSNDDCSGPSDTCEPVTCHKGRGFQGVSCDGEFEYLRGINSDGSPDCQDLSDLCPDDHILSVDSSNNIDCHPLFSTEIVEGADSQRSLSCPAGQIVQSIRDNGEIVCTGLCEERQEWDRDRTPPGCVCVAGTELRGTSPNKTCECPTTTPKWHNNQCVTCADVDSTKPKWNSVSKQCEACPSGQIWNGSACAVINCPSTAPYRHNGGCHSCKANYYYNGICNQCPSGQTYSSLLRTCAEACPGLPRGRFKINRVCQCPFDALNPSRHAFSHSNQCGICDAGKWWNSSFSPNRNISGPAKNKCQTCSGGGARIIRSRSSTGKYHWDCVCRSPNPRRVNNSSDQSSRTCKSCPGGSVHKSTPRCTNPKGGYCFPRATRFQKGYAIKGQCECTGGRAIQPVREANEPNTLTTCGCPDPNKPKWTGSSCVACPTTTPKWNSTRKRCEACPTTTPKWNSTTKSCEACSGNLGVWDGSQCRSSCAGNPPTMSRPAGGVWRNQGQCLCPANKPDLTRHGGGTCVKCSKTGRRYDSTNKKCYCPSTKPWFDTLVWPNKCKACPSGTNWNGSACIAVSCPVNQGYEGGTCVNCGTRGYDSENKRCKCSRGKHLNIDGNCVSCWGGRVFVGGSIKRCRCKCSTPRWISNRCQSCPSGQTCRRGEGPGGRDACR